MYVVYWFLHNKPFGRQTSGQCQGKVWVRITVHMITVRVKVTRVESGLELRLGSVTQTFVAQMSGNHLCFSHSL